MTVHAWPKNLCEIVNEIDEEFQVGWDTDSNISILTNFIEEHCDPALFTAHVRRIAEEESAILDDFRPSPAIP